MCAQDLQACARGDTAALAAHALSAQGADRSALLQKQKEDAAAAAARQAPALPEVRGSTDLQVRGGKIRRRYCQRCEALHTC